MTYSAAERLDIVDLLHGNPVADPYRWLEDADSADTEAWSTAQDQLVRFHLDGLAGRDHLANRLRELMPGFTSAPHAVGDRELFSQRTPDQEHAVVMVRDAHGEARTLLDPAAIDPSLTTTLDGYAPSKDGKRVAYLLSEGGRESATLRVIEVDTGEIVDGPISLGRGGTVGWVKGGSELAYVRCDPDAPAGEEQFHRRVYLHRVGEAEDKAELIFGEGRDKTAYYSVSTSRDGRWLMVSVALGTAPRNDLYLCDLEAGRSFVTVQEGVDASTHGGVHRDGKLYLFTDLDAPRNRLVVTDPATPTAEHWQDLLPQTDDVLTGYVLLDDSVLAMRSKDVVSVLSVHDKATGAWQRDVGLPGLGVASLSSRPDGGTDAWVTYTDFVTPAHVLHYPGGDADGLELWAEAPGAVRVEGVEARQVFFTSADGTRVPMFVIAPAGIDLDSERPTVLYGYGGFNVAMTPGFSSSIAAWTEAGGVYAIANLRGGSEYGEEWHRAGMRANKQNVFDDFIGAAEWLIQEGYTSPEFLAISGGSNGGLLVGAALTQRPDLYRAVVCSAPLLDMVRYELTGLGRTWNDEYGRADDPEELGWLLGYSPYHRVTEKTAYPAVLFTVFDGDTRVDPFHARKLCAALQHATSAPSAERPVLIRREKNVGHGARAVSRTIALQVDTLSFMASHTGLSFD
ncbi:MAG: prolyl oligopeptidase family serine peptidase [Acidimicrobiales bacterium]